MQFKDGATVYSFDGRQVGHINRVVLNPKTKEVTDIIVRKGFLFAEDKVVPLNLVESSIAERILLREDAGNLDALLPFKETHYISLDEGESHNADYSNELASPLYWYPPMDLGLEYPGYGYDYQPRYRTETEENIPEGTIALKEGAAVFSSDNHHIGNVAQVFTEAANNRVSYFLISEGIVFKHQRRIPAAWIRAVEEGNIHLTVGRAVLDGLIEVQEA